MAAAAGHVGHNEYSILRGLAACSAEGCDAVFQARARQLGHIGCIYFPGDAPRCIYMHTIVNHAWRWIEKYGTIYLSRLDAVMKSMKTIKRHLSQRDRLCLIDTTATINDNGFDA